MPITTAHRLLTGDWTDDVQVAEAAIRRFAQEAASTNTCHVVLFEIAGDRHLHVNVTHRHQTIGVSGWAGPGSVPGGFIHNRTFSETQAARMLGHIRKMVLAERM